MTRFTVTMTWDDFPEGGSYGTTIEAESHEEAERLVRQEMAENRAGDFMEPGEDLDASLTPEEIDAAIAKVGTFGPLPWQEAEMRATLDGLSIGAQRAYLAYGDEWEVVDCYDADDARRQEIEGGPLPATVEEAEVERAILLARLAKLDAAFPVRPPPAVPGFDVLRLARETVADDLRDAQEFDASVIEPGSWEVDGDAYTCDVYLSRDHALAHPDDPTRFRVLFQPHSSEVKDSGIQAP